MYCQGDQHQGWQHETTCMEDGGLFWFKRFLDDAEYANSLHCQWDNLRNNILSVNSIFYLIDSLSVSINEAVVRDLEKWHNDRKHLESYCANKSMGGGVVLDVIHEFDYLYSWFYDDIWDVFRIYFNT